MFWKLNKKTLTILIIVLFSVTVLSTFAVAREPTPMERKTHAYNSETICIDNKCNSIIYSSVQFAYEDNEWKNITDARSLMNKTGIKLKINYDEHYPLKVLDFNYTSITVYIELPEERDTELKVTNMNGSEGFNKIIKKRTGITSNQTLTVPFGFDKILHYGDESTTVQITAGDDTYVSPSAPSFSYYYRVSLSSGYDVDYEYSWDGESQKINTSGAILRHSVGAYNWTEVRITIEDCLDATNLYAFAGTTSALPGGVVTEQMRGPAVECSTGSELTLPLGYETNNTDMAAIGFIADSNVTLSEDTESEYNNWELNQTGSWEYTEDRAYKIKVYYETKNVTIFIKFDTSSVSGTITEALLFLDRSSGDTGIVNFNISNTSSDWSEEDVNWTNRPTEDTLIVSEDYGGTDDWTIDVTSGTVVQNLNSYKIEPNYVSNNIKVFRSSEYSPGIKPYLNVTYTAVDACDCPEVDNNWEIDMGDYCVINDDCNLGIGKLNFTGTGNATCNATINTTSLGDPGANGVLYVDSDCILNIY